MLRTKIIRLWINCIQVPDFSNSYSLSGLSLSLHLRKDCTWQIRKPQASYQSHSWGYVNLQLATRPETISDLKILKNSQPVYLRYTDICTRLHEDLILLMPWKIGIFDWILILAIVIFFWFGKGIFVVGLTFCTMPPIRPVEVP